MFGRGDGARFEVLRYDGDWDLVKRAVVAAQLPKELDAFERANPVHGVGSVTSFNAKYYSRFSHA